MAHKTPVKTVANASPSLLQVIGFIGTCPIFLSPFLSEWAGAGSYAMRRGKMSREERGTRGGQWRDEEPEGGYY
jgi:hypothetical protein